MNNTSDFFRAEQPPVQPKKPAKKLDRSKIKRSIYLVLGAVLLIILGTTCWYTVDDQQQAVVTTFGQVTDVTQAGIHFKMPFGIQRVKKVDTNVYQRIELGYRSTTDETTYEAVENESKMITGDYNIVNVDFFVEYKISDPVKYLYNAREPEAVFKNLVQSQIRSVIGSASVDSILTAGKNEIEMRAKELIMEVLDSYDIGLMLADVKIQDAEPPTVEVIEAFKSVETAKQGAETAINQAKAYENAEIPKAEAQADQLVQNAEYLKQNRINEATRQIAIFEATYREYAQNPGVTRSRMYYEALMEVLPGVKLYIDASENGTQKLLALDGFFKDDGAAQ